MRLGEYGTWVQIEVQKSVVFLYTNNKQLKREIKKLIPITKLRKE